MAFEVVVEHVNHLGIVVEVCREIGVAEWLTAQDPTVRQRVSVGTCSISLVAIVLCASTNRCSCAAHAAGRRASAFSAWRIHSCSPPTEAARVATLTPAFLP